MNHLSINAPHIVHEIFSDDEAAIINLKTGNYYSLNPTGAEIWSLIEKNASGDEVVNAFNQLYETDSVDMASEINNFIKELEAEDLIVRSENGAENSSDIKNFPAENQNKKNSFVAPILERFADLQELLLLDPIHDVDEAGFPHKKAE